MNCKNCQDPLEEDAQFCNNCGGKVINSRITFKFLITDLFINVFGVDSKFFLTLRKMITHPNEVIEEYINGVRKRYLNPFAFFAISAGLSLLIYNFFAEDYLAIQSSVNKEQIADLQKIADEDLSILKDISNQELTKLKGRQQIAKMQLKFTEKTAEYMLRYFNLLMFIFLPFYALLSKWTYRKPHNFGEHIIINAYVYGFATYFSIVGFFISMLVHPSIYMISMVFYILYYLYVFGKLYNHSFGKIILKLLRFILVLIIFSSLLILILGVLVFVIGYILAKTGIIGKPI